MPHEFTPKNRVGKLGEQFVNSYFKTCPDVTRVIDVSDSPLFQAKGIDAFRYVNSGNRIGYDVKTDCRSNQTGNLFIETKSSDRKDGNFLTSEADEFVFYLPQDNEIYIVNLLSLRKEYYEGSLFKEYEIKKSFNVGYTSVGHPIPKKVFLEKFKDTKYIDCLPDISFFVSCLKKHEIMPDCPWIMSDY